VNVVIGDYTTEDVKKIADIFVVNVDTIFANWRNNYQVKKENDKHKIILKEMNFYRFFSILLN